MSRRKKIDEIKDLLQIAAEVELSTIPIYLYTYYSINRMPELDALPGGGEMETFANKAGGILMSVAVEEMLHLSLASNILKALGGRPRIYGRSPKEYPGNLKDHAPGFSVGLTKLTSSQLEKFIDIEKPAPAKEKPQGLHKWETLGQFYEYIAKLIKEHTEDEDFRHGKGKQLANEKGYYAPNNIDTVYPEDASYIQHPASPKCPSARGANQAQYANADDSGNLKEINSKQDALDAITEISEQGEGFRDDPTHKFDDPNHLEDSHWFKYKELHKQLLKMETEDMEPSNFVHNFPDSPKIKDYPANYLPVVNLCNAVYSYLLWMTEISFKLEGNAQSSMFYIGMHKGMIFILDKLIGGMRYLTYKDPKDNKVTYNLAPNFENFKFSNIETAKSELIGLCTRVSESIIYNEDGSVFNLDPNLLGRIKDLPDVYVVDNKVNFA